MEDVFRSIYQITKTDACMRAYHEPRYDSISEVMTEEIHEVSYNKGKNICMTNLTIILILGSNIVAAHTTGYKHLTLLLDSNQDEVLLL